MKLRALMVVFCMTGMLLAIPVSGAGGKSSEAALQQIRHKLDRKLRELQYLRVQLVLQFLLARIEDYRKKKATYPVTLQAVTKDLSARRRTETGLAQIYYRRVRTKGYYLFHKGRDGKAFTSDDIHLTDANGYFEFRQYMGIIRTPGHRSTR